MRRQLTRRLLLGTILGMLVLEVGQAQQPPAQAPQAQRGRQRGAARGEQASGEVRVNTVPDRDFLEFPLSAADEQYRTIDGAKLKKYLEEFTAISRRYRDAGHQYWGRITGTDGDKWNAEWMAQKLRDVGATNVRIQSIDLPPQWVPNSWKVVASAGGNDVELASAWPVAGTLATPPDGLDLEAVYLGWGSEADFIGRDVRGKAVFIYAMPSSGSRSHSAASNGAVRKADELGAAAIFIVIEMPGNIRHALYPQGSNATTMSLGSADGAAMRKLFVASPDKPPRVKLRLDAQMVPRLTTANVWGEVPGTSGEDVMIIAHRDGYFEGASDNAAGVVTAIGIAEYFAKQPPEKRKRTIRIVGSPGHHATGGTAGVRWLNENHETIFPKTAFLINSEHTAQAAVERGGNAISTTNAQGNFSWGAAGSQEVIKICTSAYDAFGIPRRIGNSGGPGAEASQVARWVPASTGLIHAGPFFHSDAETDATIPAAGLAASTRAYAKIIDEVNKLTMEQLRAPATAQ